MCRSQAAGDFAKSAAVSTSLQMMAVHDQLVQRMKTVADTDSQATEDDDVLTIVVFESSNSEPDIGRVDVQRVDPDRLSAAPAPRQSLDKKPAVATPSSDDRRPRVAERSSGNGPVSRPSQAVAVAASRRSAAQLVACVNKYGDRQGELKDPLSVACLPGGEIVVSEWGNRRLQVFDASGRSLRLIAPGQVERTVHLSSKAWCSG